MDTKKQHTSEPQHVIYKKQADQILKQFQRKGIKGFYFQDAETAVKAICQMIPPGSMVGLGGSVTIVETGLIAALRDLDINLLDRYWNGITTEEIDAMRRDNFLADIFISSSNAITLDGKLVNMDGTGNRVAALIYGPKKVFLIAGMNKVVATVDDAITRIKTVAAPLNAARINRKTPCHVTGICQEPNCLPPNRICNQLVIIESNTIVDRMTVFLIGDHYGF